MRSRKNFAALEAVLFACGEPVEVERLAEGLGMETAAVRQQLTLYGEELEKSGGLRLLVLGETVQLCAKEEYDEQIQAVVAVKKNTPLSGAALETLAVIAYNQPVTKSFVEQVRGVDSSQIVNNLVEKGLVEEAGRLDIPGKPISYRTTVHFLRCFGLKSLENLPPLPDENGQVMLEEVVEENASLQEDRSDG